MVEIDAADIWWDESVAQKLVEKYALLVEDALVAAIGGEPRWVFSAENGGWQLWIRGRHPLVGEVLVVLMPDVEPAGLLLDEDWAYDSFDGPWILKTAFTPKGARRP